MNAPAPGGGNHGEDAGPVVIRERCAREPRMPLRYSEGLQVFGLVGHIAGIQHIECHVDAIRRSKLQGRGDVQSIAVRVMQYRIEVVRIVAGPYFHAIDDGCPGISNVPVLVQGVRPEDPIVPLRRDHETHRIA